MNNHRENVVAIYQAALQSVHGRRCVYGWLQQHPYTATCRVVAIGKAAAAMAAGAMDALGAQVERALIITRHGYADLSLSQDDRVAQLVAGHPIPDQHSLAAGQTLLNFIADTPETVPILFLISGGSSAMVEVLAENISLKELQKLNHWLLASGLPIQAMNAVRGAVSKIKAGRLIAFLQGRQAQVLLISDVAEDDPAIIGSGLLYPHIIDLRDFLLQAPDWLQRLLRRASNIADLAITTQAPMIPHEVIANAADARMAAAQQAVKLGYCVVRHDRQVYGDIHQAAAQLMAEMMTDSEALHIWSGETTIILPENPGRGGRCQSLTLAYALLMEQQSINKWLFLAAGTDGCDGMDDVAGAVVDQHSLLKMRMGNSDPQQCLLLANAGFCLQMSNDRLHGEVTGTNVMDLMLALNQ